MGPVRVGNAAFTQIQHDAYGQIVLSNAQAFFDERLFAARGAEDFASLERVGERAWEMHDKPDAGLWEFRTRAARPHLSAVMSWAACDRLANIAETLGLGRARRDLARAAPARSAPRSRTKAWHEESSASPRPSAATSSTPACSSSLDMRFLEPDDPRFLATFEAVEKGLRRGEHMLRYAAEDDFGLPETAFNFCTFWLIEALHLVGRSERGARALREDAGAADPGGPAVRGYRLRNRRAVGQLSADLFACRTDQLRGAPVPSLE